MFNRKIKCVCYQSCYFILKCCNCRKNIQCNCGLVILSVCSFLSGDPPKCTDEYNTFHNGSGRNCPPDTIESHHTTQNNCQRNSCTGKYNTDDTAKTCFAKSGQSSYCSQFYAHKSLAESNDHKISNCRGNCLWFMEEYSGNRFREDNKA